MFFLTLGKGKSETLGGGGLNGRFIGGRSDLGRCMLSGFVMTDVSSLDRYHQGQFIDGRRDSEPSFFDRLMRASTASLSCVYPDDDLHM